MLNIINVVGLKWLLSLIEAGQLRLSIDLEASWTQIADVAQQLLDRIIRSS